MRVDIDGLWYDGKLVMKWVDPSDIAAREHVIATHENIERELERLAEYDEYQPDTDLKDRILSAVESCF